MFNPRFVRILGLLAVLMAATAATAQPAPRSVPDNDNFANARPLTPGGQEKVKDPAAATEEASELNPCTAASPHNSVWFTFTPNRSGWLHMSTAGTQLINSAHGTNDTMLGVWTGASIPSLVNYECNDDFGSFQSELTFYFYAGTQYHIQLTTFYDVAYAPESFYKLTTRITFLYMPPFNNDFETPLSPADWTLLNNTGDAIICSSGTYPPLSGSCAFKFAGSVGESSKLVQKMNLPPGYKLRKGGMLILYGYYRGMDAATIENAKIVVTLGYSDGTPSHNININLNGEPSSSVYGLFSGFAYVASPALSKVKLQVRYKSTAGTLLLDNFALSYGSGTIARTDGGVLPVPPAASRGN